MNLGKLEDMLEEFSRTIAVLEMIHDAFVSRQDVYEKTAAKAVWLIWSIQNQLLNDMLAVVEGINE